MSMDAQVIANAHLTHLEEWRRSLLLLVRELRELTDLCLE